MQIFFVGFHVQNVICLIHDVIVIDVFTRFLNPCPEFNSTHISRL